jgi:hypothetical protein
MAAYLLMMYMIAPLSWDHQLVYALPAVVLLINLLVRREVRGTPALVMVAAILMMAWRFPLDRLDIVTGWRVVWISVKLYTVIVLWVFFIARLNRHASQTRSLDRPLIDGIPEHLNSVTAHV